ncbi:hypothetical protein F442_20732, partial [Phytophthora nicotianae P10297]
LAELEPQEIEVGAVERTAWTPVTPSNILYGVSKVDRYLRAKERHQNDFEARLNKAQEDHAGVIAKLKAKIAK